MSRSEERTKFSYKGITIKVIKNDITSEKSDCIVNAANEHLAHGGGVAGAISSRGGPEVQRESSDYVRRHGMVPTGQVAVTGPGRLPCKKIIHAVGPVFSNGRSGEDEDLESAVINSYIAANDLGYASISIPAISSGIFGYPKPRCAKVMIRTTKKFIDSVQGREFSLKEIRLTNFDEETTEIMEGELDKFAQDPEQEIVLAEIKVNKPWYMESWLTGPGKSSNSSLGSGSGKSWDSSGRKGEEVKKEDQGGARKGFGGEVKVLKEIEQIEEVKTEDVDSEKSQRSGTGNKGVEVRLEDENKEEEGSKNLNKEENPKEKVSEKIEELNQEKANSSIS